MTRHLVLAGDSSRGRSKCTISRARNTSSTEVIEQLKGDVNVKAAYVGFGQGNAYSCVRQAYVNVRSKTL